ncbi:MAG: DUF6489 family protein [Pseudomonadota bacterium]
MKITIDVDCTPAEARAFFGLPDLTPVHEAMTARLTEMASKGLKPEDFQAMLQAWMPGQMAQGWEEMQKTFWQGAMAATQGDRSRQSAKRKP